MSRQYQPTHSAYKVSQEKINYAKRLAEGLPVDEKFFPPNFSIFPEVLPPEEKDDSLYVHIFLSSYKAIAEGDLNKLQAYLGPAFYCLRQRNNRNIHQKRWTWLSERETLDVAAQLFNFVLLYARKSVHETYINVAKRNLETNIWSLESDLKESCANWTLLPNNAGYIRNPDFSKKSVETPVSILEKLEENRQQLKAIDTNEVLTAIYENAMQFSIPILTAQETNQLRLALKSCLHISVHGGSRIETLVKNSFDINLLADSPYQEGKEATPKKIMHYSTETVPTLVSPITYEVICHTTRQYAFTRPEIQKSIAEKIDDIFNTTSNLAKILNSFHLLWHDSYLKCQDLEKEYRDLVNENHLKAQQEILKEEYSALASVRALEKSGSQQDEKEIADASSKITGEEIIESGIGKISLALITLDHNTSLIKGSSPGLSLLATAIEQCNKIGMGKEEQENRLSIAAYLIQRGCSPFLLPGLSEAGKEKEQIISKKSLPWKLLVATLLSLVCITRVAEEIRQVLLDYSEKNVHRKDDKIGLHRRQAVMRLIRLLYDSQNPNILQENKLIEMIEEQIKQSPRGWFDRSSLYEQLQMIVDKVQSNSVIFIDANIIHASTKKAEESISVPNSKTSKKSNEYELSTSIRTAREQKSTASDEKIAIQTPGVTLFTQKKRVSPRVIIKDITDNPDYDSDDELPTRKPFH